MEVQDQTKKFMLSVKERIGNHKMPEFVPTVPNSLYYTAFGDDFQDDDLVLPYGNEIINAKTHEVNDAYMEALDSYIGAKIVVPGRNAEQVLAKVKRRKRDSAGNLIRQENENPILDSRVYELEFPDGRLEEFSVNVLAENLFNQADDDGWDSGILKEIIDYRRIDGVAVPKSQGVIETETGQLRNVITTKGWEFKVLFVDQSTGWLPLSALKESNQVELAEFACAHNLTQEPAFK